MLRRNRPAVISLYVIAVAGLLAVFAYALAPDDSINANQVFTGLAGKPAGFSQRFLRFPVRSVQQKSYWKDLFVGAHVKDSLIPVKAFFFARDTVVADHVINDRLKETLAIPARLLMADSSVHGNQSLAELQSRVHEHNISRRIFLLGTDAQGRDVLSRVLIALRTSITAGLCAAIIALFAGVLLGFTAAYYRGWLSRLLVYLTDMFCAIPAVLLVFPFLLSYGKGFWQAALAIGIILSARVMRITRAKVTAIRDSHYVQSACMLGLSGGRIITRHVLPGIAGSFAAITMSSCALAIALEAGLSFLGIGIQPPTPSLGSMIRENTGLLAAGRLLPVIIPGLILFILALAFNILAGALKGASDADNRRADSGLSQ